MARTSIRTKGRLRRKRRIRKNISGSADRPRLSVFRSAKHIYAQVIDDERGHTLASASSLETGTEKGEGGKLDVAKQIGARVAQRALEAGASQVVFDRNGFLYHGRVKALADAAREAGLKF